VPEGNAPAFCFICSGALAAGGRPLIASAIVGSSALLSPLVFWFLVGSGIGSSFRVGAAPNGMSYFEYLYPGTLILIMLFIIFSIIENRREGFLQSVLVPPISPGSIVCGKILDGTTLALLQGLIFLFLASFAGLHLTLARILVCLVTLFVVGFGLTGLVAWPTESTRAFTPT
jgi:ABC-2 type transport system permease protein